MKIFIVDDHVLFRDGLVSMLESQEGLCVVGQAGSVAEALDCIPQSEAEVVLMDINLPDGNGLEAVPALLSFNPELKIVVITVYESDELLFNAVRLGAAGYILKQYPKAHFLASLKAIESGEAALSREMTRKLMVEFSRLSKVQTPENDHALDVLTYRELEVLRILGTGASNQEIAKRLHISENTVKSHVHNILEKLKLMNRKDARNFAQRMGLSANSKGAY